MKHSSSTDEADKGFSALPQETDMSIDSNDHELSETPLSINDDVNHYKAPPKLFSKANIAIDLGRDNEDHDLTLFDDADKDDGQKRRISSYSFVDAYLKREQARSPYSFRLASFTVFLVVLIIVLTTSLMDCTSLVFLKLN